MKNIIVTTLIGIIAVFLLVMTVKGQIGDPIYYQREKDTRVGGPYEASNSTSRYALTEAIVENKTFEFTDAQAKFATPDLVYDNGKWFSVFMPGVSFVGVPFYMLGKLFGMPQLFTYASTAIVGLINMFLVVLLARRFGASQIPAMISGVVFLFATNALVYAHSFTQHQFSTMVVLLALLNVSGSRSFIKNMLLGVILGVGLLFDIPNVFLILPVLVYVFFKSFIISESTTKFLFSVKLNSIGLLLGVIPFLAITGWYNFQLTGSYTKIGQFIGRTDYRTDKQNTQKVDKTNRPLPFNTRRELSGAYTLLLSNERSWLFYSPIVLVGIIGSIYAYREKERKTLTTLGIGVILITILIYSMFGDPWGGWSFGPRYLIPSASVMCAFVGIALQKLQKNFIFVLLFFALLTYSAWVSTLGILTTSSIPPKVEAVALSEPIPYTYTYNLRFVEKNKASSLLYNIYFSRYISLRDYILILTGVSTVTMLLLYGGILLDKKRKDKK